MRIGNWARLVCPDDQTDMILYASREDVPKHLRADLARLEHVAMTLYSAVVTEAGYLYAGPGLLESKGLAVGGVRVDADGGGVGGGL
jgi:hypothetical protein